MFCNRKFYLILAISMLACHFLLVEACAPKIHGRLAKIFRREKPCTDTRRQKIRVGRNPTRYVIVDDYGAHGGKLA